MNVGFYSVYFFYFLVGFDFNIIYSTQIISILENIVVLWNAQDFNSQELENVHEKCRNKNMFQASVNILACYGIRRDCFQQFVSTLIFINHQNCRKIDSFSNFEVIPICQGHIAFDYNYTRNV